MKKLAILMLFIALSILFGWQQMNSALQQPLNLKNERLLTITAGTTMHKFSKELVNDGYIDSRFWLRNYARLFPGKVALKVGTYQLLPGDSLLQVIEKVTRGKEHQLQITFVEGSTLKEWLSQLRNNKYILKSAATESPSALSKALSTEYKHLEGWFFPETYAFTPETQDIDIVKRAYQKMQRELAALWQNRASDLPYSNSYEALIMASIIEKETAVIEEQPRIAAVFVNRLNKKMRLQTDPTVIYGLGDRYKGDITRKHLREKTAYNTYRINGLPPTPIAMPGLKAIKAALNPEQSDYLYFVSKGNGTHYFSKSLAEHNQAVRKYQLGKS
ncbi:endolytic transglycosylase MltG [Thalassotalea algicola]|nr:endolytic transglycosylase MltG [Thalassotalea algicola]